MYVKGVAITANSPASTGGAVVSYSVTPALPAGLGMSAASGTITGTPTAVTPTAGYTVTATNAGGVATTTLLITVNDKPPAGLGYTTSSAIYTVGQPIAPDNAVSTGGAVASYSVSPALPAGLSLNTISGQITGTPTVVTAAANYTITATNASGNTSAIVNFTVMAQPSQTELIPNMNQLITPLAPVNSSFQPLIPGLPKYPSWQAGQAVSTAVSPDGNTLLILTSGYNRIYFPLGTAYGGYINADSTAFDYANSEEYIFVYDISKGAPVQKQVLTIPNSYNGVTFDPTGQAFYVSGGMGDYPFINGTPAPVKTGVVFSGPGDDVHVFALNSGKTAWVEQPELVMNHGSGLALNATNQGFVPVNSMIAVQPMAAGVAVSSDGQTMAVANYYNDSITMFTGGLNNWTRVTPDIDLRPGDGTSTTMGTPGGEYPFWVVIQGTQENATAYISSIRDREVDVVSLGSSPKVTGRIPVKGEPNKMAMNKAQTRLYVAEDMSDTVDVIDISSTSAKTGTSPILESISVIAPPGILQNYPAIQNLTGANPNSVSLSPDETQLYVTDGNLNSVAVVQLSGTDKGDQVTGLIPTGWYPNSVSFGPSTNSPNGNWVYVVNGKSPTGPNPGMCYSAAPPAGAGAHKNCFGSQLYNPQLIKAGFQSFPQPTPPQLANLTAQVAINDRFAVTESASDLATMGAVRQGIQHVIFIIKENRGYDQVLGDLEVGNGDPSLTEFGQALTPNQHNLAKTFVTLDNMMARSETSTDGWPWTTGARTPDVIQHQWPVTYAYRGLSLDAEGEIRNVNVAIPTVAGRVAADPLTPADGNLLPGAANVAAPDGPDDVLDRGKGYLWDQALRAGLTVRNYGFFIDGTLYSCAPPPPAPAKCFSLTANLNASDTIVSYPNSVSLTPYTDQYYKGFDNQFPDFYRYQEWLRDFNSKYAQGGLPSLSLVRLMHDHTGNFNDPGGFGLNTPELQQADNDYSVGLLVQTIANSPVYKNNTLIFIIEDDSQDSGDHVDSHRTIAFVAGAYVKQGALVSTAYTTVNFLRTIEEVLGLPPMNLNDAVAAPMADIFNTTPSAWTFTAAVPASLYLSNLPLPPQPAGLVVPKPLHSAQYWARATRRMDFDGEDRFDFAEYNRVLWKGIMGNKPYRSAPTGKDLRQNRQALLARYRQSPKQEQSRTADAN